MVAVTTVRSVAVIHTGEVNVAAPEAAGLVALTVRVGKRVGAFAGGKVVMGALVVTLLPVVVVVPFMILLPMGIIVGISNSGAIAGAVVGVDVLPSLPPPAAPPPPTAGAMVGILVSSSPFEVDDGDFVPLVALPSIPSPSGIITASSSSGMVPLPSPPGIMGAVPLPPPPGIMGVVPLLLPPPGIMGVVPLLLPPGIIGVVPLLLPPPPPGCAIAVLDDWRSMKNMARTVEEIVAFFMVMIIAGFKVFDTVSAPITFCEHFTAETHQRRLFRHHPFLVGPLERPTYECRYGVSVAECVTTKSRWGEKRGFW
jgi:hypothetical protein